MLEKGTSCSSFGIPALPSETRSVIIVTLNWCVRAQRVNGGTCGDVAVLRYHRPIPGFATPACVLWLR